MVAAVMASDGVIFICVQARDRIIGMDGVGEEPGLKSVASTTASPDWIIVARVGITGGPERIDRARQQHRLHARRLERQDAARAGVFQMIGRGSLQFGRQRRAAGIGELVGVHSEPQPERARRRRALAGFLRSRRFRARRRRRKIRPAARELRAAASHR